MSEFVTLMGEMRRLLDRPLAGGRGAQMQQDREIQECAKKLAAAPLPDRSFKVL